MELEITQQDFCTAVATPSSQGAELYERCKPFFDEAQAFLEKSINYLVADFPAGNVIVANATKAFVCLKAYHAAIPSIDLIWSSTGFGIVSNNTLAPASRERVDALRQNVMSLAVVAKYCIIDELATIAAFAERQTDKPFVWRFSQYCGIAGDKISIVDFDALAPKLRRAENRLKRLISAAELDNLRELSHLSLTPGYNQTRAQAEAISLIEEYTIDQANGSCTADGFFPDILAVVNDPDNAESFPNYTQSSEYEANNSAPYENTLDKPTFFFC